MPKTRQDFWQTKLEGNAVRDRAKHQALRILGWKVIVLWECEITRTEKVYHRLNQLLSGARSERAGTEDEIT